MHFEKRIFLFLLVIVLGIFYFQSKVFAENIDSTYSNKTHYKISCIFEDDNYLLSLKNYVKLKDGDDYGYTYALNLNGYVIKKQNAFFVKYHKSLYTKRINDSIGDVLMGLNTKTNQKLKLVNIINVERILIGYEHDAKFKFRASFGLEHRGRINNGFFSATNIQSLHHRYILGVAGFYYANPNGENAASEGTIHPSYSKEILTDEISPFSLLSNLSIGKTKNISSLRLKLDGELGGFLSTENSKFIGQNSNLYGKVELHKFFGKKSKFTTTLSQNIKYYSNCNATNNNLGYVQKIGISYFSKYKKIKLLPSLSFFKPFGRLDFQDFNDNDINVLIKLDIDF